MKKRRNLIMKKCCSCALALTLFVSAFFHASINVDASQSGNAGETYVVPFSLSYSLNNMRALESANTMLQYCYDREYTKDGAVMTAHCFYNVHVSNGPFLTTNEKYYAYKIRVIPKANAVRSSSSSTMWSKLCVGQYSDMYNGGMMLGQDSDSYQISEFWIESNYSVQYYYLGNLAFMHEDFLSLPSISLNAEYEIYITPYTYSSYMSDDIQNQIKGNDLAQTGNDIAQKTQNDMNAGFDDVMNGYDASRGDDLNDELYSNLDWLKYQEDEILGSVNGGLDSFEFAKVPALVGLTASLSFVGTLMTSFFHWMDGMAGVGILLSVLFSVVLASMAIGFYRFYQRRR